MSMNTTKFVPFKFSVIWLMVGIVSVLVLFAALLDIDQAVRAQGQVIAGSRTQVIQAVDGGMLVALHVREGDTVKAGQKLAELEQDRAQAGYIQSQAEVVSRTVAITRAHAELTNKSPRFTAEHRQQWGEFVDVQLGIYTQRKRSLDEELAVLQSSLRLAQEELDMNRRLLANGDISQTEVMRAQRQVLDLQARISGTRNKYLQDTRLELAKLEDELSVSRNRLSERQNVLRHTDLVSPMDGVVKVVRVTTVGGVLRPGDELLQISPLDDELLVEIKVNPMDVGQLETDLAVSLRFDAFDSTIFGKVPGVLRYISPDTLSEQGQNGQTHTYYRALVALNWDPVDASTVRVRPQDIKPGMTATADVLTGERSLLNFVFKPITRAFSGALIQR
jgi:adhesin transport system membrane fusion protein